MIKGIERLAGAQKAEREPQCGALVLAQARFLYLGDFPTAKTWAQLACNLPPPTLAASWLMRRSLKNAKAALVYQHELLNVTYKAERLRAARQPPRRRRNASNTKPAKLLAVFIVERTRRQLSPAITAEVGRKPRAV